jgi:hypothetical protein
MRKVPVVFGLVAAFQVLPAFAGGWAVGQAILMGSSQEAANAAVESATRLSLENAKAIVASRGQGCIGRNLEGPDSRIEVQGNIVKVYTFYSHWADSCGQSDPDSVWIKKQVEKLIPKL